MKFVVRLAFILGLMQSVVFGAKKVVLLEENTSAG